MLTEHEKVVLKDFIEENWSTFADRVGEDVAEEIISKLES